MSLKKIHANTYPMSYKFCLALTILIFGCTTSPMQPTETLQENQLCIELTCIQIEKAITSQEQTKGLMFRENLNENSGMLFIFPDQKIRQFWMKNTLIPLDMIWINENKEIIGITKNAQPCKADPCQIYASNGPAKYVLEINAGFAQKKGLEKGQKIDFN